MLSRTIDDMILVYVEDFLILHRNQTKSSESKELRPDGFLRQLILFQTTNHKPSPRRNSSMLRPHCKNVAVIYP